MCEICATFGARLTSNTRKSEKGEYFQAVTGLGAVKIETECYFLRHQFSTADWAASILWRQKKKCETREEKKAYASHLCTIDRLWWLINFYCCSGVEIMCNIANRLPYIHTWFQMYWTSFIDELFEESFKLWGFFLLALFNPTSLITFRCWKCN
jgi:hypothetical protein